MLGRPGVRLQDGDRVAPRPILAAAHDVDAVSRHDEGRIVSLEDPAGLGQVCAVAIPEPGDKTADLCTATRFLRSTVDHQHRSGFEELGQGVVIAEEERVFEQGFQLLRRSRSHGHGER